MAAVNFLDIVCNESIINVVNSAPEDNIIISSYGGDLDAGYAMHDSIESKKQKTIAIGCVASAAAVGFAGGSERMATKNTTFVLHNPSTIQEGTAAEMQIAADILKAEEEKLLNFWASKLTISRDEVKALLDADIKIDANEALRIGLIHKIITNIETMNFKLLNWAKTKGIKVKEPIKNSLTVTPTDGQTYTFPDIDTKEQITKGTAVKDKDGKPFTGEFILQSGEMVKCTNGMVDSIEMPEQIEDEALIDAVIQNSEALMTENADLKLQVTNLTKEKTDLAQKLSITNQELSAVKDKLAKAFPDGKKPIEINNQVEGQGLKAVWNPTTKRNEWK